MRTQRIRLAATSLVAIAVLSACAGSRPEASAARAVEPAAQGHAAHGSGAAEEKIGQPAAETAGLLHFEAKSIEGGSIDGSDYLGRPAVFWFWAPGCGDCVREAPAVLAARAAHEADIAFVGIAGGGTRGAMDAAATEMGIDAFTQIADVSGAVWRKFGIVAQPAYAFIDSTGRVEIVRQALGGRLDNRVAALAAG